LSIFKKWFGGSNKKTKMLIQQQERIAAEQRAMAEAALQQQATLHSENKALQEKQLQFQKEQAEYVKETNKKMEELANRPPPPAPSASGTVVTGGMHDDTQSAVDSRKRGRKVLRIDLNAPQVAGDTGLNVPRG